MSFGHPRSHYCIVGLWTVIMCVRSFDLSRTHVRDPKTQNPFITCGWSQSQPIQQFRTNNTFRPIPCKAQQYEDSAPINSRKHDGIHQMQPIQQIPYKYSQTTKFHQFHTIPKIPNISTQMIGFAADKAEKHSSSSKWSLA